MESYNELLITLEWTPKKRDKIEGRDRCPFTPQTSLPSLTVSESSVFLLLREYDSLTKALC